MRTIKLTVESADTIKSMSTVVNTESKTYYYMPYWLEATDDEHVFIVHSLDNQLPTDLVETILNHRR